jgi:hypothetical protein
VHPAGIQASGARSAEGLNNSMNKVSETRTRKFSRRSMFREFEVLKSDDLNKILQMLHHLMDKTDSWNDLNSRT